MADTGENRQIIGRANAKEAETVRVSKRFVTEERSRRKTGNAAFPNVGKDFQHKSKGNQQRSADPKPSKR